MTAPAGVLLVKATGHALATLMTVGNPASVPSAAAMAGAVFPVRDPANGQVVIEIAPDGLDTKVVPLVDDLLIQPENCSAHDHGASLLATAAPTVAISATAVTVSGLRRLPRRWPCGSRSTAGEARAGVTRSSRGRSPQDSRVSRSRIRSRPGTTMCWRWLRASGRR